MARWPWKMATDHCRTPRRRGIGVAVTIDLVIGT